MSATTPLTIEGADFSVSDRRNIAEAAARINGDDSIPDAVREIAVALLNRIAEGEHVAVVDADADDRLSPNQAAALVGVSRPLLNRLLDDGRIPFFTTEGGHRKIKRSDVEAYIDDRDKLAHQLAEARRAIRTVNEDVAAQLGLTAEQSKRLGLS